MTTAFNVLAAIFTVIAGYFLWSALIIGDAAQQSALGGGDMGGMIWAQGITMQADHFQLALTSAVVAAIFLCAAAIMDHLRRPPSE